MINNLALKFDEFREGKQTRLELGKAWLVLATGPDTIGIIEKVSTSAPDSTKYEIRTFLLGGKECV